jgi:hypothetical protein|tara:strand:+ start:7466 stop:7831 length:366 start_codon:yes stop_codon:yes gene_type:complete
MGPNFCQVCQGSGQIQKEPKKIKREVWFQIEPGYSDWVFEIVTIGGTDACSKCAREAETDYQVMLLGKRQLLEERINWAEYQLAIAENNDSPGMTKKIGERRDEVWKLREEMRVLEAEEDG